MSENIFITPDPALAIPDFLKRNPNPEPTMRPADTQAAVATPEQQKEFDVEAVEDSARTLTKAIAQLDTRIGLLKTDHTAKHKELGAVISKLVTIKLKMK